MTLATNIPKDVSQGLDTPESAFVPLHMPTETMPTHLQNATNLNSVIDGSNMSHEDIAPVAHPQPMAPVENAMPPVQQPVAAVENATPVAAEPQKDLEAASPTKAQPVRKISRFLVSPAILTVANEKTVQNACIEEPIKSPPAIVNQPPSLVSGDVHQMPQQANQVTYF